MDRRTDTDSDASDFMPDPAEPSTSTPRHIPAQARPRASLLSDSRILRELNRTVSSYLSSDPEELELSDVSIENEGSEDTDTSTNDSDFAQSTPEAASEEPARPFTSTVRTVAVDDYIEKA